MYNSISDLLGELTHLSKTESKCRKLYRHTLIRSFYHLLTFTLRKLLFSSEQERQFIAHFIIRLSLTQNRKVSRQK